jgi:hypothetical protein
MELFTVETSGMANEDYMYMYTHVGPQVPHRMIDEVNIELHFEPKFTPVTRKWFTYYLLFQIPVDVL